ncbi:MAG: DUF1804 family protein [Campylobacteraceae bacterium]
MAKLNTTKEISFALYLAGKSVSAIADLLGKSEKTIKNYKTKDWDVQKAHKYLANTSNNKEYIYNNFIEEMHSAIKEIRESELKPAEKAKAYVAIGDSFIKMKKVAITQDPEMYRLAIIKKTISTLIDEIKVSNKECIQKIVEILENPEFIKKLENINVY